MNDFDSNDIDRRIAEALRTRAAQVDEHSLRPALSPRGSLPPRRHIRWSAPLLAAAAVVAIVAGTVAVTTSVTSSSPRRISPGSVVPGSTTSIPPPASASDLPLKTSTPSAWGTAPPVASTFRPPEVPGVDAACPFADLPCTLLTTAMYYVPIYPFVNYTQARRWQDNAGKTGSAAWNGDAVATAQNFVQTVLGFTDLTVFAPEVVKSDYQAYVRVGYRLPNNSVKVASTIELVRYGPQRGDVEAPWEVVRAWGPSNVLMLESPTSGSGHTSPLYVHGTFSGVDGNLVVSVRDQDGAVVGQADPLPAGGQNNSWSTQVHFKSGGWRVRLAVVYNGGAVVQHAEFAVEAFYS